MTDIGIRGSRFIMANPDEAAAILHERLGDLDLAFLTAVVRDSQRAMLCQTPGVTIEVHQNSVLNPANPQNPRPTPH